MDITTFHNTWRTAIIDKINASTFHDQYQKLLNKGGYNPEDPRIADLDRIHETCLAVLSCSEEAGAGAGAGGPSARHITTTNALDRLKLRSPTVEKWHAQLVELQKRNPSPTGSPCKDIFDALHGEFPDFKGLYYRHAKKEGLQDVPGGDAVDASASGGIVYGRALTQALNELADKVFPRPWPAPSRDGRVSPLPPLAPSAPSSSIFKSGLKNETGGACWAVTAVHLLLATPLRGLLPLIPDNYRDDHYEINGAQLKQTLMAWCQQLHRSSGPVAGISHLINCLTACGKRTGDATWDDPSIVLDFLAEILQRNARWSPMVCTTLIEENPIIGPIMRTKEAPFSAELIPQATFEESMKHHFDTPHPVTDTAGHEVAHTIDSFKDFPEELVMKINRRGYNLVKKMTLPASYSMRGQTYTLQACTYWTGAHHVCLVRQADGSFLLFNDATISRLSQADVQDMLDKARIVYYRRDDLPPPDDRWWNEQPPATAGPIAVECHRERK